MIFVTSDLHIGHNKEFLYKPRGFSSIEEHDKALIENWNNLIKDYPTICSNFDDGKTLKQKMINLCGHTHTKDYFVDWNRYNFIAS